MTDGLLDVSVFSGRSLPQLVGALVRQFARDVVGRSLRGPEIEFWQGRAITIESDPPLPVQIDGEPIGETPVRFEIVPRALQILVPPKRLSALGEV